MAYEITIRYGQEVAASGTLAPGEGRLDLTLPRLPATEVHGSLEARAVDQPPPTSASASCISEWLRCGDAAIEGDRVVAPLTFDSGPVLSNLDRAYESTIYVTLGTHLARIVVRIPSLAPPVDLPGTVSSPPTPEAATAPLTDIPADLGNAEPVSPSGPMLLPPPAPPAPRPEGMPYPPPPPPPAYAGSPAAPGVCRNHPEVPTNQYCAWCRNPFCNQCLVELRGSYLCGWCKQAALAQMQQGAVTVDARQVVLWARVYDIVMALGALAVLGLQLFSLSVNSGLNSTFYQSMPMLYWLGLIPSSVALLAAIPPAVGLGPGRKWAYLWQMIMLIPSMLLSCLWASCFGLVFWPAAIVLLVYWIKPEVKEYCERGA